MKTILIPTDFSETAANAINYAVELAKLTDVKLLLCHAYYFPFIISEVPFLITSENYPMEEDSNEHMKVIVQNLQKLNNQSINIEYLSIGGIATDVIINIAKEKNVDLIIMGTEGIYGDFKFWGSNTSRVVKHSNCPILVIPSGAKFKKIDKIVFAFDFMVTINDSLLSPLIQLALLFNSEIIIFHLEKSDIAQTIHTVTERIKLKYKFDKLKYTFLLSEKNNLVDAINELSIKNNAVMITMIKRHHTIFERIFNDSNTELMSLYTHLPLLILHEGEIANEKENTSHTYSNNSK